MFYYILAVVLVIILGVTIRRKKSNWQPANYLPVEPDYWSTQAWQFSPPEEQGMDSAKLVEMIDFYQKKNSKTEKIIIDSITIIRNGYIVADLYFNPLFPKNKKHIIHSCTKSIVSALIGIAIKEGFIENVNVLLLDIFKDKNIKVTDKRLKVLRLKDLLTMQTGWHSQDSYLYQWKGLFKMQTMNDWVKYILNLPFEANPNTRHDYSNMASFLLSAVIKKTTGMDTLDFAKKHLFQPLGIKVIQWEKSPQGIDIGWARMWLKPHDMAKIGLLYLQKGKWEDQQIIPVQWVEESLTAHSFPKKYRKIYNEKGEVDRKVSGGVWLFANLARPFSDGYGYQWWLGKNGRFSAVGTAGQYIMVSPKENLVVAVTSKLTSAQFFLPVKMFNKFIVPSIKSNERILPNEVAHHQLLSYSDAPQIQEVPKPVPELPAIAKEISDETFSLEKNPWRNNDLKLEFDSEKEYAVLSYLTKENEKVSFEIGLNNVYRLSESHGHTYAAVGEWETPNQFRIDYELMGYSTKGKWTLTFEDENLSVEEIGQTGTHNYQGKKKLKYHESKQ